MTLDERARKRHRDETFRRMMADRDVSDQARVLGAHVYLLGKAKDGSYQHEIGHRDFAIINAGRADDETIRRRLQQLRVRGYLQSYRNGSRNPLYEFAPCPVVGSTAIDPTPRQGKTDPLPHISAGVDLYPTSEQGRSDPPGGDYRGGSSGTNPPPPPPPAGASAIGEREATLREWLNGSSSALDDLWLAEGRPAEQRRELVASSILGSYGPGGMGERWWPGATHPLTPADQPVVIAEALRAYALEAGKPFDRRFFAEFAKTARDLDPKARARAPKLGTEHARVAAAGVEIHTAAHTPSGTPTRPELLQASIKDFERRAAAQRTGSPGA